MARVKKDVRINNFRTNPREALRGLVNVHERAARAGVPVSAYLEHEDPTSDYNSTDGPLYQLDAFGRLMYAAGVVTRSNPAAGLYATTLSDLATGEHKMPGTDEPIGRELGRAMLMVWIERQVRRAKFGSSPSTRTMFVAENEDEAIGSAARPWSDAGALRDLPELAPAIPISALVANEVAITGTAYRSIYVDETEVGDFDYQRVTEGSEIPEVTLGLHERTTRLHKKGRAIKWTYEAARQLRLDKMRITISKMALDVEYSKVSDAITVLYGGDGNANTAPEVIDLSDMDAASAGDLTMRALLNFRRQFVGAYQLNTLLARDAEIVDFELMPIGTDQTPLVALPASAALGTIAPLQDRRNTDGLQYAAIPGTEIPTGEYLGFDRRFALERVTEIGAEISEADKFITSQVNVVTFTDVDGFATLFPAAVKILDMDA